MSAKVSVKMVPVLVFFIFPALMVVILGPAVIIDHENTVAGVEVNAPLFGAEGSRHVRNEGSRRKREENKMDTMIRLGCGVMAVICAVHYHLAASK